MGAAYALPHAPDDLRVLSWTNKRVHAYNKYIRGHLQLPDDFVVGETVIVNNAVANSKGKFIFSASSAHKILDIVPARSWDVEGRNITMDNAMHVDDGTVFVPYNTKDKTKLLRKHARAQNWSEYGVIKETWADVRPIYASTVHSAQGSTYKECFVDLQDIAKNPNRLEVIKLMHVALTRSSGLVHVYGDIE